MLAKAPIYAGHKKSRVPLIAAPGAVMLLMSMLFALYDLYPFGENTLSWCDMTQQVVPILLEFKDILAGKQDFFLNMNSAGGMNFWGVFLFFISSPFSFLTAFVSKADMSLFMNVLVALKMMTCAFTAAVFFRRQFKGLPGSAAVCLSVMYAFCGYAMLFYQNIVWLDMMYLFPLLLLSFGKLLEEQKLLPYVAVLCSMLVVNFYLSYMMVVFILLSMGIYLFFCCDREQRRQNVALLCAGSLLSALITAPVWLPALKQYLASARTGSLMENLSSGNFTTHLYTSVPLLFSSALVFAALPFFMAQKQAYSRMGKTKINCALILFALMVVPVFVEPINKMWHTGSYQAFPVRYGYITVFLGLILAAIILQQSYGRADCATAKIPLLLSLCSVIVLHGTAYYLLAYHKSELDAYTSTLWGDKTSFTWLLLYFTVGFLCYFCVVYLFRFGYLSKRVFTLFLCLLLLGECIFNGSVYIGTAANGVGSYRQAVDLEGKIEDDSFYRVKTAAKYFDVNLMGGIGYHTLGHYTSLDSQNYMFALKKMGYSSYWMEVNSNNGTLLTDALLSNRYTVKRKMDVTGSDTVIYQNQSYAIVKNELCLPLGIKITAAQAAFKALPNTTRIDVQEYLYSNLLGGKGKLFTEYGHTASSNVQYTRNDYYSLKKQDDTKKATLSYQIKVDGQQVLYFDCFMYLSNRLKELINDSFQITVNGRVIEQSYPNQSTNGLYQLGAFENETVTVEVELLKNITAKSFGVYGLDVAKLQSTVSSVPGVEMRVSRNCVTASCEAEQGDSLYVSLPYDKGYRAYVNGHEAAISRMNDDFMAIPLQSGENQITLAFVPDGFAAGMGLCAVGILLLVLVLWRLRSGKYRLPRIAESALSALFGVLAGGVFIMVYIFPVIVYFTA